MMGEEGLFFWYYYRNGYQSYSVESIFNCMQIQKNTPFLYLKVANIKIAEILRACNESALRDIPSWLIHTMFRISSVAPRNRSSSSKDAKPRRLYSSVLCFPRIMT